MSLEETYEFFSQHSSLAGNLIFWRWTDCQLCDAVDLLISLSSSRIMSEIIEVPFPRAASRRFMSFFTFHISKFFSASVACWALMMGDGRRQDGSPLGFCQGQA